MTLGSHQRTVGKSQNHLTPKWLIDKLGPFDLDPCAASPRPWDCAVTNISLPLNGVAAPWFGMVWLNPPFDRYVVKQWIDRLAAHNNGIALLHARTETAWFQPIWKYASGILFLDQRLTFCKPDGSPATTATGEQANSGAPPVLAAFGNLALERLAYSGLSGWLVQKPLAIPLTPPPR